MAMHGFTLVIQYLGSWGLRNLIFKVPGVEKAHFVGPGGPGGLGILRNIDLNVTIPTDFLELIRPAEPALPRAGKFPALQDLTWRTG